MSPIYPCHLPFCNSNNNNKMLLEDYSNAVYWRIAAIFSTIAALFSVAVILWFLIFRDNPNLPDDTDSEEKLRFSTGIKQKRNNLISELTHAFKHFPKLTLSGDSSLPSVHTGKSQNFLQRLIYFIFGSFRDEEHCSNNSDSDWKQTSKLIKKPKKKQSNDKGIQRFFNATKKSNKNKSKNNNNNNNNVNKNFNNNSNRLSVSETQLVKATKPIKTAYSEYPFNSVKVVNETCSNQLENNKHLELIKYNDFLCDIKENQKYQKFPDFSRIRFADALLKVNYHKSKHSISIEFDSVTNLSGYTLRDIRVVVEIYFKRRKIVDKQSRSRIDKLPPGKKRNFNFKLDERLKKSVDVSLVKLSITLVGQIVGLNSPSLIQLVSSSNNHHILGGAIVELKDYLHEITVD